MKKELLANSFIIIGTIAYGCLFWSEVMGLKVLLLSILLIGSLLTLYPDSWKARTTKIMTFGMLITGLLLIQFYAVQIKVLHLLSMLLLVASVLRHAFRFIWYALVVVVFTKELLRKHKD
jgi:hypothetical protein